MKFYMHVNYYEGPNKLETLFQIAEQNKYDGIELRAKYRFEDMTQEQYQTKLCSLKQCYPHLDLYFGLIADFYKPDWDQVRRNLDDHIAFMAWAHQTLGTRFLNFFTGLLVQPQGNVMDFHLNGSAMAEDFHYQRSAIGLKLLGEAATDLKMTIALETHNNYLHDLAGSCKKILTLTDHPAVGINYDHGNIVLNQNGESIEKAIELLGEKIYLVHLKNVLLLKDTFLVTHLEQGQIDTSLILSGLKDLSYRGPICLEYPSSSDGIIAAKRDKEYVEYLRDFLDLD